MNLVFNGTSVSLNRCNYFWRDYLRTQVSSADAARIYKSAGGAYDHYDQTPVVVSGVGTRSVGITQDTGIKFGFEQPQEVSNRGDMAFPRCSQGALYVNSSGTGNAAVSCLAEMAERSGMTVRFKGIGNKSRCFACVPLGATIVDAFDRHRRFAAKPAVSGWAQRSAEEDHGDADDENSVGHGTILKRWNEPKTRLVDVNGIRLIY